MPRSVKYGLPLWFAAAMRATWAAWTTTRSSCSSRELPASFHGGTAIRFQRPNKPDRTYKIFTPTGYNHQDPASSKVLIALHGWGGDGTNWTMDKITQRFANQFNYIVVGLDGLGSNEGSFNSWAFAGSNTGLTPDGTEPTCDTNVTRPNYCYNSCGACENRCAWTHCQDDDVQFVQDLILGGETFKNALSDTLCFDDHTLFLAGASNGAMLTWNLLQDERTSGFFRAAAPMMGNPHHGYNFAGPEQTPLISFHGTEDELVPPSNKPWPGKPTDVSITSTSAWRQKFVTTHTMVSTWAKAGGCSVHDDEFPTATYRAGHRHLECHTWCDRVQDGAAPYAVSCAFPGSHEVPQYAIPAALRFFEAHSRSAREIKPTNQHLRRRGR